MSTFTKCDNLLHEMESILSSKPSSNEKRAELDDKIAQLNEQLQSYPFHNLKQAESAATKYEQQASARRNNNFGRNDKEGFEAEQAAQAAMDFIGLWKRKAALEKKITEQVHTQHHQSNIQVHSLGSTVHHHSKTLGRRRTRAYSTLSSDEERGEGEGW
ncbi:hypothetical protein T439DRAFT_359243 [Meredithblackwellia eburnea MCA 4105]